MAEIREVRVGSGRNTLGKPMTKSQAERWGKRNAPKDGDWKVDVFTSDPEINGGKFYRVSFYLVY